MHFQDHHWPCNGFHLDLMYVNVSIHWKRKGPIYLASGYSECLSWIRTTRSYAEHDLLSHLLKRTALSSHSNKSFYATVYCKNISGQGSLYFEVRFAIAHFVSKWITKQEVCITEHKVYKCVQWLLLPHSPDQNLLENRVLPLLYKVFSVQNICLLSNSIH